MILMSICSTRAAEIWARLFVSGSIQASVFMPSVLVQMARRKEWASMSSGAKPRSPSEDVSPRFDLKISRVQQNTKAKAVNTLAFVLIDEHFNDSPC